MLFSRGSTDRNFPPRGNFAWQMAGECPARRRMIRLGIDGARNSLPTY